MRNTKLAMHFLMFLAWTMFILSSYAFSPHQPKNQMVVAALTTSQDNVNASNTSNIKRYSRDAWITTKVKAALAKELNLNANDIMVTTYNQVVQLSGVVDNVQQVRMAEKIAYQIKGVRKVINQLQVKTHFMAPLNSSKNNSK